MDVNKNAALHGFTRERTSINGNMRETDGKRFPKIAPKHGRREPLRRATADQHSPIWKRLMDTSTRVSAASVRSNSCPDLADAANITDSQVWDLVQTKNDTPRSSVQNSGNSSPRSKRKTLVRRDIIDVCNMMTPLQNASSASMSSGSHSMRNSGRAVNGSNPKSRITNSSQGDGLFQDRAVSSQLPQPGMMAYRNRGRRMSKSLDEDLAQLQHITKGDFGTFHTQSSEPEYAYQSLTTNEIVQLYMKTSVDSAHDVGKADVVKVVHETDYNPAEEDPEMYERCQAWLQRLEVDDSEEKCWDDLVLPAIDETHN